MPDSFYMSEVDFYFAFCAKTFVMLTPTSERVLDTHVYSRGAAEWCSYKSTYINWDKTIAIALSQFPVAPKCYSWTKVTGEYMNLFMCARHQKVLCLLSR